jgi:hypothetical protein
MHFFDDLGVSIRAADVSICAFAGVGERET